MKLSQVVIHNFRSVQSASFDVYDYTLLVGANNSGKSNILHALRVFYEDATWSAASDMPRKPGDDEESWIELEFALTDDEFQNLPDKYKGKTHHLRVRKYLASGQPNRVSKGQSNIFAYLPDGSLEDTNFFGAKNIGQSKLGSIIYVPALSTTGDTFKMSGPSPFRNIITFLLKKVITNSKSYAEIGRAISALNDEANGADGFLTQLKNPMNSALERWGISMVLNVKELSPDDIVKNQIEHSFHDNDLGCGLPIDKFGHGFQRSVIYELIKIAPTFAPAAKAVKKEFDPDLTIILFEEPETFLHPNQQEHMALSLRALAVDANQQVLITTHSPIFVGKAASDLKKIVRLVRNEGITSVFQPTDETLRSILTGAKRLRDCLDEYVNSPTVPEDKKKRAAQLIANFPTDEVAQQEDRVRFQLFLDSDRASLFFADKVIICEGASEKALFNYLLEGAWNELREESIFILEALGKFNFPRYQLLLDAFGINHGVLIDGDDNKNEHLAINDLIQSLCGDHTHAVHQFEKDLETYLGLPKTARDDRKPLEILKALEGGKIGTPKLDELKVIFQRLCGTKGDDEEKAGAVVEAVLLDAVLNTAAEKSDRVFRVEPREAARARPARRFDRTDT